MLGRIALGKYFCFLLLCSLQCKFSHSILFPRESETRIIKDLSGRWKFRIDDSPSRHEGFDQMWWKSSLADSPMTIDMPVPSSYNDVTQNRSIRDFVGWAWYQTQFYVPNTWQENSFVWLRIGSAHYYATVWINSDMAVSHEGGHLPFETEVGRYLKFGTKNVITVAVNNTLTPTTLPPGTVVHRNESEHYPPGYVVQKLQFDFFNYAGIHRPVTLYTTPKIYVQDIKVESSCEATFQQCTLKYAIDVIGQVQKLTLGAFDKFTTSVKASLYDSKGKLVIQKEGDDSGQLIVTNPNLWWPVGMNESVAYLYTFTAEILNENGDVIDVYHLPYGIRTVEIKGKEFLINGKPFYFLGFGKHEDWDIRGKGFDWVSIIKDFNMLDWLGGNSFRTSHYPYSEEIMQLCDERGIVVVDECPAVGLEHVDNFSDKTLQHHLAVITELINRDKNHPSVVIWSVANEPNSSLPISKQYFNTVISHTKSLDTRPVTVVCNQPYNLDLASEFVDIVSVNKYLAWYEDGGHPEVIQPKLGYYLSQWYETHKKPVIQTEWGAGTVVGLHRNPSVMFTEEFQEEVMEEHFKVFDTLRKDFFVGEMIWNYADFATDQTNNRVVGNRKGVLTRQRDPKSAAFVLRKRYHSLRNQTAYEEN